MKESFRVNAEACVKRIPYQDYHDGDVIPTVTLELRNEHIRALEWVLSQISIDSEKNVIQNRIDELRKMNYWELVR